MVHVPFTLLSQTMAGQTAAGGIQTRTLTLDLLENGVDFIKEGIEAYFRRDDPRSHKYAILLLWSGTLLLLKERLRRSDPSLVFKDPAEAGRAGAKTVDFDQVLKRLRANGVTLEPTALTTLRTIQAIRNGIEHYELALDVEQAQAVVSALVAFVHGFCIDHLNFYIEERLTEDAQHRLWELEAVTDKLTEILIETANRDAEADDAYFRTFAEQYLAMTPEAFVSHVQDERNGVKRTMLECLDCREESVVPLEVGVCTNATCRSWYYLENCHSCYEPIIRGQFHCRLCGP
jgi:hypothetical protein